MNFIDILESEKNVQESEEAVEEDDDRTLSRLVDQVAFGDMILLNECDNVEEKTIKHIETFVSKMNPEARIHQTLTPMCLFLWFSTPNPLIWNKLPTALDGEPMKHESGEYGVTSFVYREETLSSLKGCTI